MINNHISYIEFKTNDPTKKQNHSIKRSLVGILKITDLHMPLFLRVEFMVGLVLQMKKS